MTLADRHCDIASWPRRGARGCIRVYQLTLSGLVGRQCRHLPTCSAYADDAIKRFGLWRGGWLGASRVCRCHPWGTSGFDPIPTTLDPTVRWFTPWRYGVWTARGLRSGGPTDEDGLNAPFGRRSVDGS